MPNKMFMYQEIYQDFRKKIMEGELRPEERLPSEDELSAEYSVSKITVKKALELLRDENLIYRVQGRGTFVKGASRTEEAEGEKKKSMRIGLVLEHVSSSFGLNMLYYMDRMLDAEGYKLFPRFSYGSIDRETEEINVLLSMGVDGLIIMPCHDSHYNMTILKLILDDFPVVLVDKRMHGLPVSSVCTDGREAIRTLVHHLKDRGCSNAAILTIDPASTSSLGDRTEGFYTGLDEMKMTCAGECILPRRTTDMISPEPEPEYVERIREYLDSLGQLPDSFVCTEYAIARALYAAAEKRNIRIGQDCMAGCIDESVLATRGGFFTHMRQDERSIALQTVSVILRKLRDGDSSVCDIRVPAVFVQGQTT
ncbi:MAG: LacI family DNA-binding transcriptional regulator [Clostridia bacterium]|nr:LacI family DNA-binding transcriptional regulator [Clostridia bacterium]